ncbi:site-specific integrase [Nocardia sp. NPDC050412]|uniref:site-specific integrase n=1 Tax=Nocardia sp. NPDC050412 TaxID=3364320 RepID=UPI0037BC98EA
MFTTEAVGSGLPLHIAAALLGHLDLDTTRGWTAVFAEDVIRHHQQFITHRRALATDEYRHVTPEEWTEFEKHFLLRRVELGDCFRPYGTPCIHEHACVRCPFLRLDPTQRPRLEQMQHNARACLDEARHRQWLGEVSALQETLRHIDAKLA